MIADEIQTVPTRSLNALYLGVDGLDEADLKRVQVFLRFAGRSGRHEWKIAQGHDEDLVLRAVPEGDETIPMPLMGSAEVPVTWIVSPGQLAPSPETPALRRPLQIEAFTSVLREREKQIDRASGGPKDVAVETAQSHREASVEAGRRAMSGIGEAGRVRHAAAPAPSSSNPAPVPIPAPARASASASAPAPALASASALPAPASAPGSRSASPSAAWEDCTTSLADGRAYRLVRWPSPILLQGRPRFARMLGFLASKPLTLERLSLLSGVDANGCIELLGLLMARGLLAVTMEPAMAPPSTGSASMSAATARPAPAEREAQRPSTSSASAPAGMLQRLRKRLGLGA